MKEKIEEILSANISDKEKKAKLMFFVCFNILEDDSKYTSGELRKIIYDAIDMLGVEE